MEETAYEKENASYSFMRGSMMLMVTVTAVPAFAAGDVAGAIEQTWNTAKSQIQTVVNNVVFPVVDMILAILFL